MRSPTFGPTPGVRVIAALSRNRDGGGEFGGLQCRKNGKRDLGADALHGLQQAEPFAFEIGSKSRTA